MWLYIKNIHETHIKIIKCIYSRLTRDLLYIRSLKSYFLQRSYYKPKHPISPNVYPHSYHHYHYFEIPMRMALCVHSERLSKSQYLWSWITSEHGYFAQQCLYFIRSMSSRGFFPRNIRWNISKYLTFTWNNIELFVPSCSRSATYLPTHTIHACDMRYLSKSTTAMNKKILFQIVPILHTQYSALQ